MYGTPEEDSILGKRGVDTEMISNRYNVLNAACGSAMDAQKRVKECEQDISKLDAKLDKIIELLEAGNGGECMLSKLVASTD